MLGLQDPDRAVQGLKGVLVFATDVRNVDT
jgi:hypothetical protein